MTIKKWEISLDNLGKALDRLGELVALSPDDSTYLVDALIQRFEFVIELYWKTFKHLLQQEGLEVALPKEALQKAYEAKWIQDEKLWRAMMIDRNQTSHTYREALAAEIFQRIHQYYPELRRTYTFLTEKYRN